MSSRALRKLQREQEQKLAEGAPDEDDTDSAEQEASPPKKINAFDMLDQYDDDHEDSAGSENEGKSQDHFSSTGPVKATPATKSAAKKSKKKKKKQKQQVAAPTSDREDPSRVSEGPVLDEIDLALQSLHTGETGKATAVSEPAILEANQHLYRLLAIESKHLNALNEMKRLFGNVVMEPEDSGEAPGRRRGQGAQGLDLSAALAARNSPMSHGQGLSGPMLRRNLLIQGKEEWPKAPGGGLGMEMVEKMDDGTIEYRFVHNNMYQDLQRQFESCVQSMDPQRMISLLIWNPYHISTLLQVSEIAKQQGDHSVAADLLERALFNFGRASQSSFATALQSGKARLDFRRPENREFWLAAWRYMMNLGQRGTWRTAYEWAKLILSLDPEGDPYSISKVIDQIALRGGQAEHFDSLAHCDFFQTDIWADQPNVEISMALIQYRLKHTQACRDTLIASVKKYPWIFARLFQELGIERIPKAVWGTTARTSKEKLDCEEYIYNGKDLWNTPETTNFLVEVIEFEVDGPVQGQKEDHREITMDDARFALLLAAPSIINCIPRALTNLPTTSYDPFPPEENLSSYNTAAVEGYSNSEGGEELDMGPVPASNQNQPQATRDANDQPQRMWAFPDILGSLRALVGGRGAAAQNGSDPARVQTRDDHHDNAQETNSTASPPGSDLNHESRGTHFADDLLLQFLGETPLPTGISRDELLAQVAAASRALRVEDLPPGISRDEMLAQIAAAMTLDDVASPGLIQGLSDLQRSESNRSSDNDRELDIEEEHRSPAAPSSQAGQPSTSTQGTGPHNWQNWLAGRGIALLKRYTAEHGLDVNQWPPSRSSLEARLDEEDDEDLDGRSLLRRYASRILSLQDQNRRRFLMDHALRQGAGEGVRDLVKREVEGLKGSEGQSGTL